MIRRLLSNRIWYARTKSGRSPRYPRRGGDAGEEIVLKFCKKEFHDADSILHSIRIPDPDTYQNKGEVDVIICLAKATFFLEVKHWKGLVDVNDEGEFNTRKIHGKAIQTRIETKTNSAKRMFLSRFGYSMGDVYPLIVFSHDRCRFSDKLDRKSNVVKLRDLHTRIRELEDGIGDELEKRVRENRESMLQSFGTWDMVSFDDGSSLIGDITNQSPRINRKELLAITASLDRSLISTIFRGPSVNVEYLLRDGSLRSEELGPNFIIDLNIPWENRKKSIPLEEIHRLEFGYKDDIDWIEDHLDRGSTKRRKKKRKEKLDLRQLKEKYKIGQKLSGTVVHHLPDNNKPDHVRGLIVSIVENQVNGLIPKGELPFQELIPLLRVGTEVQVEIIGFRKEGLMLRRIS